MKPNYNLVMETWKTIEGSLYYRISRGNSSIIRTAVADSNKMSLTHILLMQRTECNNNNLESVVATVSHIHNWNRTRAQRPDSEIASLASIFNNSLYKLIVLNYLDQVEESDCN